MPLTCSLPADGYGNPGLFDDGLVVTWHIERWSLVVVWLTSELTDEDAADPELNPDGWEA